MSNEDNNKNKDFKKPLSGKGKGLVIPNMVFFGENSSDKGAVDENKGDKSKLKN